MYPLRHTDCLDKQYEAMIYRYKNNEDIVIFKYTKNYA